MESAQLGLQPGGKVAKMAGVGSTEGKQLQRGSFIRFHANMVVSSPYFTPAHSMFGTSHVIVWLCEFDQPPDGNGHPNQPSTNSDQISSNKAVTSLQKVLVSHFVRVLKVLGRKKV